MSNKIIEIGAVIGAVLIGFGIASASLEKSNGEVVDGDRYYDAEGDSGNRFSDYGRRDERGSFTTSMPLNLGGKRSKKKTKKHK